MAPQNDKIILRTYLVKIWNNLVFRIRYFIKYGIRDIRKDNIFGLIKLLFLATNITVNIPVLISAISTNYLFNKITLYWSRIPFLFDSVLSRLGCTGIIAMIGILFFWLRQHHRGIYASIEFGTGLGLGYYAAAKLSNDHKTDAALAAMLGCIYIIVRACDNFYQASKAK